MGKTKKKRRKAGGTKLWLDDDSYIYLKSGEYVRQKLANRRGCELYRTITPKPDRRVLICRTKEGRWKAISILRYIGTDLRTVKDKDEVKDIKRAREIVKKLRKSKIS